MTGKNNYHSVAPWGVWNSFSESPIRPTDQTISSILKKLIILQDLLENGI